MESYKNLEEAVWKQELCTSCGACSAVCPSGTIIFKNLAPAYTGKCKVITDNIPCGACYNSCGKAASIGTSSYTKHYAAKSNIKIPNVQSGGAVTSLLVSALDSGIIDGAILMSVDRITQKPLPVVVTNRDGIIKSAGSRYTWNNVLSVLGDAVKSGLLSLAIVGTPCTIQSVRRIMNSNIDVVKCYGVTIKFTIGVFCTGIFGNFEEAVCKELGVSAWQIRKMEIKGNKVHAYLKNEVREVQFKNVKNDILVGCPKCTDFSAAFADISAGNTGSEEGFTTLVVRTQAGEALVSNAVEMNALCISNSVNIPLIEEASRKKWKNKVS